jgi:hypothetical protein
MPAIDSECDETVGSARIRTDEASEEAAVGMPLPLYLYGKACMVV